MTQPNQQPETNTPPQTNANNSKLGPMVQPQVQPADQVGEQQLARFVTTIKNAEQQVGEHIIRALKHNDTVAVITTVVMGQDGQQHVVSAALSPGRMQQVQELLQAAAEEREDEEPCVGFHCLVNPKNADKNP